MDRIEPFMSCFENADKTICIDHHISNNSFADVNYVEPQSSSACEVLYTTFDEDKVDKNVAECIYTGIIHDTGVFKYSCTSRRTMDIAGKMMEMGIDYSDIIDNSFYKKSYIQNQILGRALLESVLFYDGRCIFSSVSIEEMNFYGVTGKELGFTTIIVEKEKYQDKEISTYNNILCMQLINKNPAYKIFRLHIHEFFRKRIFNLNIYAKILTQSASFTACRYKMLMLLWTY
jgi:nanoRNase/pAp phosphatase (c-di-AMP/oligoRNAs hydrolase)